MANDNLPGGLDSILGSGFLFGGRYRPESLIGRGGMATVYRARQPSKRSTTGCI